MYCLPMSEGTSFLKSLTYMKQRDLAVAQSSVEACYVINQLLCTKIGLSPLNIRSIHR